VTVLRFLLPMLAGNMLVMDNSEQITYQLPYSKGEIALRLHGRSFSECEGDRSACSFDDRGFQYVAYT
jgi:hypothetical protein